MMTAGRTRRPVKGNQHARPRQAPPHRGNYFLGLPCCSAAVALPLGGPVAVLVGEWAPAASSGGADAAADGGADAAAIGT